MQQDQVLNQLVLPASELEQAQDDVQKLLALLVRPIPQVCSAAVLICPCCVQDLKQQ